MSVDSYYGPSSAGSHRTNISYQHAAQDFRHTSHNSTTHGQYGQYLYYCIICQSLDLSASKSANTLALCRYDLPLYSSFDDEVGIGYVQYTAQLTH